MCTHTKEKNVLFINIVGIDAKLNARMQVQSLNATIRQSDNGVSGKVVFHMRRKQTNTFLDVGNHITFKYPTEKGGRISEMRQRKCVCGQSCPALCKPMDCSPPGSSVNGIFSASILQWVVISPSGDPPDPGIKPETL